MTSIDQDHDGCWWVGCGKSEVTAIKHQPTGYQPTGYIGMGLFLLLSSGVGLYQRTLLYINTREKGFFCVPIKTSKHQGAVPEPPMFVLSLAKLAFIYLDDMPGPADGFCL